MRRHAKVTAIMPGRDKGWPTSQVMPMLLTTGAQSCTPTPIGNRLLTAGRMSSSLPCLQLPLTLKGRKTQMKVLTELPCLLADRTPPPCLSQSPETMPSPEAVTHLGLLGHPRNSLAKAGDRDTLYNWHWCVPCRGAGTAQAAWEVEQPSKGHLALSVASLIPLGLTSLSSPSGGFLKRR